MKQMLLTGMLSAGLTMALSAKAQPAPAKDKNANETLELLRRTIAEQQKNPDKIIRTFTNQAGVAATSPATNRAQLDRQYRDGQLTPKQYQSALDQLAREEKRLSNEAARRSSPATNPPAVISPAPTPAPTASEPTPRQKEISDVEKRIDEMLRLKAEREKAATNSAAVTTNALPSGPQTKRQKLDALLKQVVAGSITDAEYKARREKLLLEPD